MDKIKLLNLFIFAFAASVLVQFLFFPSKNTSPTTTSGILLQIKDDALTVPNIPIIEAVNYGTGNANIDTCRDIKISIDTLGEIKNIQQNAPDFCTQITLIPGEKKYISFTPLYKVFAHQSGKYIVTLTTEYGDRITSFEMEEP